MKILVPGRICLFGEHSDWAGGYRRFNADISPGMAIITGTNQCIHARVKPHPSKLIVHATLEDGRRMKPFETSMNPESLLKIAQEGGFYSYAAGVAYRIATNYRVRGIEIDNYRTDLPVKKGLSSSAAVCVLVARAFNRLYDLKLTVRGEMELAYLGEITTPSRCGRLDQGCAFGQRPVLMTFDADNIAVSELNVPNDIYMVIVDLKASKNTHAILNKLNHCYPFAENEVQSNVQKFLGGINRDIARRACEALNRGDAPALGRLMNEAQREFDRYLGPACPEELTAPALHGLLNHEAIQPYIYGGKGVGSQGDGSAQLVARDEKAQRRLLKIIADKLNMSGLPLVLHCAPSVRKAVIPAAGFGTRLFPATKSIKKELFPVIDSDGRAKPVILAIVEEALAAGIEEICILAQERDKELFESLFCDPPPIEHFNKLSSEDKKYSQYLRDVGYRVSILVQDDQEGFGHAVYCAREWVGDEPFLLMLGDHLYRSHTRTPCAKQLIDAYARMQRSSVGLAPVEAKQVCHFGCVAGEWKQPGSLLEITEFAEKPTIEFAREHLAIADTPEDTFLSLLGMYVLSPKIFDFLHENITHNIRENGEFQLTSCLEKLRRETGFTGFVVQGERFDIGTPQAYAKTLARFSEIR